MLIKIRTIICGDEVEIIVAVDIHRLEIVVVGELGEPPCVTSVNAPVPSFSKRKPSHTLQETNTSGS